MPSSTVYNLLEACHKAGCPACRLEQKSVERYLENQFYENVNQPHWRGRLRASHGFCHEHAWLGVNKRLGDSLGYSIIYGDIVNSLLNQLQEEKGPGRAPHRRSLLTRQIPEAVRNKIENVLSVLSPRKRCPVCEYREETRRSILSALVEELGTPEMTNALQASEGLCLPHWGLALEHVRDLLAYETLLTIQREKLEGLRVELAEFIRKNEYQAVKEGFGKEGDAWLRAIGMVVGSRRGI